MDYLFATREHLPELIRYSAILNREEADKERLQAAIGMKRVWVAVPKQQAVGYIMIEQFGKSNKFVPNSVFISELFVDEEYRSQGIGSELVKQALHTKLTDEYGYFSLTHDPKEDWLTKFYTRFGFEKIGVTDVGNVVMVKKT